jgi:hypothetical protein
MIKKFPNVITLGQTNSDKINRLFLFTTSLDTKKVAALFLL